jgi:hypothetical protein
MSIKNAATFFFGAYYLPKTEMTFLPFIGSIIGVVIALLLWMFPIVISRKIYPLNTKKYSHYTLTHNDLYHLGFVMLGSFLLFFVFSDLIYWFTILIIETEEFNISFSDLSIVKKASVITTIFEFILAIIFIFYRKLHPKNLLSSIRFHKLK